MISSRFAEGKMLRELSTFGIGGPARYFIEVKDIDEMQDAISYSHAHQIPFLVIGKGSNCLFDDRGFDGLVILNKIGFCEYKELGCYVGAGFSFSLLGVQTARKGWAGLEFASGIPASVGGAIYMNAGANGGETAGCLCEVIYILENGDLRIFPKEKLSFSYRSSSFQSMKGAIVAARFKLSSSEDARQKQLKIVDYRTHTQPYGDKSAGCVFRNPAALPAGALIEQCGLKGAKIGGAEVSCLHANFIVNKDKATAKDVLELASLVKQTVLEKKGVHLEMEIRTIPYTL